MQTSVTHEVEQPERLKEDRLARRQQGRSGEKTEEECAAGKQLSLTASYRGASGEIRSSSSNSSNNLTMVLDNFGHHTGQWAIGYSLWKVQSETSMGILASSFSINASYKAEVPEKLTKKQFQKIRQSSQCF